MTIPSSAQRLHLFRLRDKGAFALPAPGLTRATIRVLIRSGWVRFKAGVALTLEITPEGRRALDARPAPVGRPAKPAKPAPPLRFELRALDAALRGWSDYGGRGVYYRRGARRAAERGWLAISDDVIRVTSKGRSAWRAR